MGEGGVVISIAVFVVAHIRPAALASAGPTAMVGGDKLGRTIRFGADNIPAAGVNDSKEIG